MKASEVIKALEKMIHEQGDLPCVVYDGGDPSDRIEVDSFSIVKAGDWFYGHGKAIAIESQ